MNWQCVLSFSETIKIVVDWYKNHKDKKININDFSFKQIEEYEKSLTLSKIKIVMKVVILAGGFGTRLSEYTKSIPKPLVEINKKPILGYIIEHYVKYGFKDFIIALGYKGNLIKKYFKKNYKSLNIQLVDTGLKTMTGGRLKRLKNFVGSETFLFTYGDGVSNVNLKKLINQHKKTKKLVTLTAVRPPARFGALKINNENVINFREKSKLDEGWINGGYFTIEPKNF